MRAENGKETRPIDQSIGFLTRPMRDGLEVKLEVFRSATSGQTYRVLRELTIQNISEKIKQ